MTEWRKAISGDLAAIAQIERLCFSTPWTERSLTEALNGAYLFTGLLDENKVIGYFLAQRVLDELSVQRIAVLPAFRRKGNAEYLLSETLWQAKNEGCSVCYLEVRTSNEPAKALYRKIGFSEQGIRPGFYTDPTEDALLMSLSL